MVEPSAATASGALVAGVPLLGDADDARFCRTSSLSLL
jgi:hypothetical protein